MLITNLTQEQVDDLQGTLKVMAESNPQLGWNTFYNNEPPHVTPHPTHHVDPVSEVDKHLFLGDKYLSPVEERLQQIEEKVDRVLAAMQLVFGGHVLLNGRWVKL